MQMKKKKEKGMPSKTRGQANQQGPFLITVQLQSYPLLD